MFAKAFRLFVSSTFQDFGNERRLLQERVFPALEVYCAKEGFGFRAVDMRWGVNDDAQVNQRTAEICLGEVLEARGYPAPNLLILIGDRYGWVPLPFAIARDEFEAIRAWLAAQGQNEAVSDLDRVYALDENHLVPGGLSAAGADLIGAYTLRSREDDLSELKPPEAWAPVEALLCDALLAAAGNLHAQGQLRDAELGKYTLSLTEQEIRKGLEQLAEGDGVAAANSIAWVRTTATAEPLVQALAEVVKHALPEGHVLHAPGHAESAGYADHFVEQITARLTAAIDAQIAEFKARAKAPGFGLQTDRTNHAVFAAERLRVFLGRESNLAAIAAHIGGEARHPLVLTGTSGSGKTALMAKAAAETEGKVVQRFVGASASSADQRNLLISVIEDLASLGVASLPGQWEDDDNRFVNQVRDILAALDRPVAIFIDALDQLRAPFRPMWLPPQLNPRVKLIVSVLDDEAFAAERTIIQGLRRSLPAEAFLDIEPLRQGDGADILAGLKREAQRGLGPDQEAFILERFEAAGASPLYLRIAFAIARRWRSTDDPRARGLAGDVTALIGQFLDELSSVHHQEPLLVRRALGLIAAGREGLSESETIAVLSRDADVMAAVSSERFGAKTDRLPDSVWVRLKRSLAALLVEKGEEGEPLIRFFHRQVAKVVRERFYEPEKAALHGALAAYFAPPAKSNETDPPWTRRGLLELPFQLFHAGMREQLDALLTNPAWIDWKVQSFAGSRETIEDFDRFSKRGDQLQSLIGRTLRLCSNVLGRDPRQAMVQLHGRLIGAATDNKYTPLLAALLARIPNGALFETRRALTQPGAETARLDGYNGEVWALAVLRDGRLASGSFDKTVRIWDVQTGEETVRFEHGGEVCALAVLPDGRLASGAADAVIRIWDTISGAETARIEGLGGPVTQLAALSHGCLAFVTGGYADSTIIRIWDVGTGAEKIRLKGHEQPINVLAALPDGRLASGSDDKTIRIWDLDGVETNRLEGDRGTVLALAVFSDGRIASGCGDGTIRIWELGTGTQTAAIPMYGDHTPCGALAVLLDGRLAIGSLYKTIRLWNPDTRAAARLEGHMEQVTALAVLPDGRLASGSHDNTIRLWDPTGVTETANIEDDGKRITSLAVLTDGRVASLSGGVIQIWDTATGAEAARITSRTRVAHLAALADGGFASVSSGGVPTIIYVCDASSGASASFETFHRENVSDVAVLSDGRLARADGNIIQIWNPISGRLTNSNLVRPKNFYPENKFYLEDEFYLQGHKEWVTKLAAMPDGRLASGSYDNTIRIWDPATGEETARLDGIGRGVFELAILPQGRLASVGGESLERTMIRIWDLSTGLETARLDGHMEQVTALAVLPDGRLASGSHDNTIRLWDSETGSELARLEIDSHVESLAAHSDGHLLAGDGLGRLHWLAIKGAGRVAQPAASSDLAPPPHEKMRSSSPIPASWPRVSGEAIRTATSSAPDLPPHRTGSSVLVIGLAILAVSVGAILGAAVLNDVCQLLRATFDGR